MGSDVGEIRCRSEKHWTDKNIKIYNNISNSEFANIVHILVRPETNDS